MRIVILGYGSIGRRHHSVLSRLHPNATFDVLDPALGISKVTRGRYDVGIVATTTTSHLDDARRLIGVSDLVFVEKPLHVSPDLIRSRRGEFVNSRLHVGCNVRYTDAVTRLRDVSPSARMVNVFAASDVRSWRNDPKREAYSFHRRLGGGVLMDFIHEPDYMVDVFGPMSDVHVIEDRLHDDFTIDSSDSCVASWRHERTFVSMCLSYCSKEYTRRIEVLTNSGDIVPIHVTREDVNSSYERQWKDVLENGPRNTYDDCLSLYDRLTSARTKGDLTP